MSIIEFPMPIREMTKMRKDGDIISLRFSYGCIVSFGFIWIFWVIYRLSLCTIFQKLSWISVVLTVICLGIVVIYRSFFLSSETMKKKGLERIRIRKYKAINKLEGADFEEAIGNLTKEEREGFLAYSDKDIPTRVMLDWVKRDRKLTNKDLH
jgi:hypothetical protein